MLNFCFFNILTSLRLIIFITYSFLVVFKYQYHDAGLIAFIVSRKIFLTYRQAQLFVETFMTFLMLSIFLISFISRISSFLSISPSFLKTWLISYIFITG